MEDFFSNTPPADAVSQDIERYERVDCKLMKTGEEIFGT